MKTKMSTDGTKKVPIKYEEYLRCQSAPANGDRRRNDLTYELQTPMNLEKSKLAELALS